MTSSVKVLDKGFVKLRGVYPEFRMLKSGLSSVENQIVEAARMSTMFAEESRSKGYEKDYNLIKYLWNNKHTSPFEFINFDFEVKLPLFVANQWLRHRTATYWSINQLSGRYIAMPDEFYFPDKFRLQDIKNKQGGNKDISEKVNEQAKEKYQEFIELTKEQYDYVLSLGIERGLARMLLPMSVYTYLKINVKFPNLLHFLDLRDDEHAQYEIQQYAKAIKSLIIPCFPNTQHLFFGKD